MSLLPSSAALGAAARRLQIGWRLLGEVRRRRTTPSSDRLKLLVKKEVEAASLLLSPALAP